MHRHLFYRFPASATAATAPHHAAVFHGGNGFACRAYLLNRIAANSEVPLDVYGLEQRGVTLASHKPAAGFDFDGLGDDVIDFLTNDQFDETKLPIVGIGHSQGATSLAKAAAKRPDLFKALVLIEPANIDPRVLPLYSRLPSAIKRRLEPVKSSTVKLTRWENRAAFRKFVEGGKLFKRVKDAEQIEHIVRWMVKPVGLDPAAYAAATDSSSILQDADDSTPVELAFCNLWEQNHFSNAGHIWKAYKNLKCPVLVMCGKPSLFCTPQDWHRFRTLAPPGAELHCNSNYGHLLPIEDMDACIRVFMPWLKSKLS